MGCDNLASGARVFAAPAGPETSLWAWERSLGTIGKLGIPSGHAHVGEQNSQLNLAIVAFLATVMLSGVSDDWLCVSDSTERHA